MAAGPPSPDVGMLASVPLGDRLSFDIGACISRGCGPPRRSDWDRRSSGSPSAPACDRDTASWSAQRTSRPSIRARVTARSGRKACTLTSAPACSGRSGGDRSARGRATRRPVDELIPVAPRAVAALVWHAEPAAVPRAPQEARHEAAPRHRRRQVLAARAGVAGRRAGGGRRGHRAGAAAHRGRRPPAGDRRLPGAGRRLSVPVNRRSAVEVVVGRMPATWEAPPHTLAQVQLRTPFRADLQSRKSLVVGVRASSPSTTSGGSSAAATTASSYAPTRASACSGPPGPPSISASTSTASSRSPASCPSSPARWRASCGIRGQADDARRHPRARPARPARPGIWRRRATGSLATGPAGACRHRRHHPRPADGRDDRHRAPPARPGPRSRARATGLADDRRPVRLRAGPAAASGRRQRALPAQPRARRDGQLADRRAAAANRHRDGPGGGPPHVPLRQACLPARWLHAAQGDHLARGHAHGLPGARGARVHAGASGRRRARRPPLDRRRTTGEAARYNAATP